MSCSQPNTILVQKIKEHEEEIMQLRRHLTHYSVKVSAFGNSLFEYTAWYLLQWLIQKLIYLIVFFLSLLQEAQIRNEKCVLENRIAHMRMVQSLFLVLFVI